MNEKTKKIMIILESIMLILWIITTAIFVTFAFNNGTRCIANPLIYGANHLSESNNANFTCSCKFSNEPSYIINVDKDKWELQLKNKDSIEISLEELEQGFKD
jgi:hypothetical protein